MKNYKYLIEKAGEKFSDKESWAPIIDRTCVFLEDVKKTYPEKVTLFLKDLEDAICFPPITEQEAKCYVSKMANNDGTTGEHWPLETIKMLPNEHPEMKLTRFNLVEFYIALNMAWSDRYHPNKNVTDYIQDAIDFLDDKDAPKNKMRRYMEAFAK